MPLTEFSLIEKLFSSHQTSRKDVSLGIGDDAAVLQIPAGKELVVTTDTLVADVHFLREKQPAFAIGYKSLAVNLSDLAAMGAEPMWITLALTLPVIDEHWLLEFSQGFFKLIDQYQLALVGGDTTKGPLAISVQALGLVNSGCALTRANAKPGDLIYVTGTLGDGRLGLNVLLGNEFVNPRAEKFFLNRLNYPEARVLFGQGLIGIAHAAIDISDGLSGDLQHILNRSEVGATVWVDQLPLSLALAERYNHEMAWNFALAGGDDYELCFTIPAHKQKVVEELALKLDCPCACIGIIEDELGLRLKTSTGQVFHSTLQSYQHFE